MNQNISLEFQQILYGLLVVLNESNYFISSSFRLSPSNYILLAILDSVSLFGNTIKPFYISQRSITFATSMSLFCAIVTRVGFLTTLGLN
jgi:hypothetical protein